MTTNPIKSLLLSKVRILMEEFYSSDIIKHNLSKGQLREEYFKGLLEYCLSENLRVGSGFICNSKTNDVSNQIDLIISEKSSVPNFKLSNVISLFPIETVYAVIEIKTTLDSKTFDQISEQLSKIYKMKYSLYRKDKNEKDLPFVIPAMIVAFGSDLSEENIRMKMMEEESLLSICIVGKSVYMKKNGKIETIYNNQGTEYSETLAFIKYLYGFLLSQKQVLRNNYIMNEEAYLD